ncbi:hypothetical protein [Konateibacter massiliensis]|uniref:hypothetical protein n=1 Tax=Konateibacter massiliensis TaxID=2002841 RepID=UPI000C148C42|nr:hypothetical protein [Konateibacter massiliensis]
MNITSMKAVITGSYGKIQKNISSTTKKSGSITIKRSFNPARALAQLANARTKSQVSAIERTLRAQIPAMKNQEGGEQAVRQMKYVIQKANMKRQALTREQTIENNRKIAKSANNRRQEAKLERELNRKRNSRMRKEVVDALNAPGVFRKNERDGDSVGTQGNAGVTTNVGIDVVCDGFGVSDAGAGSVVGGSVDALL